jgi:methionyl-tRNA formyltransferase
MFDGARCRSAIDDTTTIVESALAIRGAELLVQTLEPSKPARRAKRRRTRARHLCAEADEGRRLLDWSLDARGSTTWIRGCGRGRTRSPTSIGMRYIVHRSRLSTRGRPRSPGTIVHASAIGRLHVAAATAPRSSSSTSSSKANA